MSITDELRMIALALLAAVTTGMLIAWLAGDPPEHVPAVPPRGPEPWELSALHEEVRKILREELP